MSESSVKCNNCGQSTTGDHCQWCSYPLPNRRHGKGKKGKKFFLSVALVLALTLSGGGYAYTYTTVSVGIDVTEIGADFATAAPAPEVAQPDWDSVLPTASTETLRPNAAGDATNITYQYPDSDEHWDKVDEESADDFSTHVNTKTTGYYMDLYNIPNHSAGSGTVNSVTVYFRFSGDSNGAGYIGYAKAAIKTNGTVYDGSEESTTGNTFVNESYQWTTNPDTGSAWTWAEIDALQIGVSLKSETGSSFAYCTQVYAVVNYTAISGDVPIGDLYDVTINSSYSGDVLVQVYLTNVAALSKAYDTLDLALYLEGSVEAGETPNYQPLSLTDGVAIFNLESAGGGTYTLSVGHPSAPTVTGGSYYLVSDDSSEWDTGWSVEPEFYCEVFQR